MISTDYEFHDIAGIFPLMSDEKLEDLAEDIRRNGLLQLITLYKGKIIDGRNHIIFLNPTHNRRHHVGDRRKQQLVGSLTLGKFLKNRIQSMARKNILQRGTRHDTYRTLFLKTIHNFVKHHCVTSWERVKFNNSDTLPIN